MSDLTERLLRNWTAWGSPTDRDACVNETCMAMDCKEAADQLSMATALLKRLLEWQLEDHAGLHMTSLLRLQQIIIDARAFVEAAEGKQP